MRQESLFDAAEPWPALSGLRYRPDFLTPAEEQALIALVQSLPLQAARYKQYTARRRIASFGGRYDFDDNRLLPAPPLDARLHALRDKVAGWLGLPAEALRHALVAEYAAGTPLGWHRDVPDFDVIAGVSLGGEAELRFRPYPPTPRTNRTGLRLKIGPRSIYRMEGAARWEWQHSVAPTPAMRWSITFRTLVESPFRGPGTPGRPTGAG